MYTGGNKRIDRIEEILALGQKSVALIIMRDINNGFELGLDKKQFDTSEIDNRLREIGKELLAEENESA